jgi:hypothetical protein
MFGRALAAHAAATEHTDVHVAREAGAAAAAARAACGAAVEAVDAGPGAAFSAEKAIGVELRALKAAADRATQRAAAWAPALDAADAALRGWGDSATFLEATTAELARVEAVLVRAAAEERGRRTGGGEPGGGGGAASGGSDAGRATPVLLPK